ncbi:bifunctional diguanylate cyclase/phosphodiesterase [Polycladidibacter stylochi]|uniref:bifunctional diguanylate cyclase/phosphodiesterase n=1 Tax=Polycladidibacter stylochi TaxID=1807766 RepID=UPI00082AD003|nr:bifunctional diguanylate cyclase/phosphodiesterase [Pseudovibrio stylochi]
MSVQGSTSDAVASVILRGHSPEKLSSSRRRMSRMIAFILLLVVLSALIIASLALFWSTEQAMQYEIAKERRLVSSYLQVYRNSLANEVERIAVSDKAYNAITSRKAQIFLDEDLTPTASNRGDRDVFIILNNEMKPIYTYRQDLPWHNKVFETQLGLQLKQTLANLKAAAKQRRKQANVPGPLRAKSPDPITIRDVVHLDNGYGLATVSAIIPSTRISKGKDFIGGYLIWVRLLDTRAIDAFEASTGLKHITIGKKPEIGERQFASIPLYGSSGQEVAHVTWQTSAASGTIYSRAAPYLLGAFLVILLATLLLLRRSIRLTDELVVNEAEATHAALHDALSGLPNRTYFTLSASRALRRSRMQNLQSGLIYLDLDQFKQINDSLGHTVGDNVILQVATRLRRTIPRTDLVSRISGDEFLILINQRKSTDEILETCQLIANAVAEAIQLDGHRILTTASMGVALSPEHGADLSDLLRRADIALYEAKKAGRNRFVIFRESMEERVLMSRQMEEEIKRALKKSEFVNYYQPIMDGTGKKAIAAEALIRWNHPKQGLMPPGAFLPVAEGTPLIKEIGEWVLETAIQDAAFLPDVTMCVNVSPSQLGHPEFPSLVQRLLDKHSLPPSRLELEVTEEILLNYSESTGEILNEIQKLGVKIALDDFGTGFSNLNYLRKHRFNKIKIDRTFIEDIENEKDAREIVRSLIQLGQSIGMEVCIEGVEKANQYNVLKGMRAEILQGFLFSKPVPLAKFKLWQDDYDVEHALNPKERDVKLETA